MAANVGTDTVQSAVNFALGAHFDNLALTGSAAISGSGNGAANVLTGNRAANLPNGVGGTDRMTGGLGNDIFVSANTLGAANVDHVTDYNVANDTMQIDTAVFTAMTVGVLSAAAFASNRTGIAGDATDRISTKSTRATFFLRGRKRRRSAD